LNFRYRPEADLVENWKQPFVGSAEKQEAAVRSAKSIFSFGRQLCSAGIRAWSSIGMSRPKAVDCASTLVVVTAARVKSGDLLLCVPGAINTIPRRAPRQPHV
jgi:hypothetical protein